MAASFPVDDELRVQELELSMLRKNKDLAEAQPHGLACIAPPPVPDTEKFTSVNEFATESDSPWVDMGLGTRRWPCKPKPKDDASDS